METEGLKSFADENKGLETQLTKRNEQYIFDLKKAMSAANLSQEDQASALHEMLPLIVQEQKTGRTARQLFGTVSERMTVLLKEPEAKPNNNPWMMWLDNVLLIFGLFGIVTGLVNTFSKTATTQPFNFITLVVTSLVGGWVFYLTYKYMYKYEQPGANRSERPKLWKAILILMGAFFVWFALLSVTQLLPAPFNFVLPSVVTVALGALALVGRYIFKKRYNVVGSMSVQRQRRK